MLETSLFVATIAALGMISPGPDFFLVIKNAVRYPRLAAMMTTVGVIAGVATHMAYCVAGLAVVITTTPWLFSLLKYVGAAYLIWLGIQALCSRGGSKLDLSGLTPQHIGLRKAFLQGYLCNLLNPKATLFFLAVFTQVLGLNSSMGEKLWYGRDNPGIDADLVAATGYSDSERTSTSRPDQSAKADRQTAWRRVNYAGHQSCIKLNTP